MANEVSPIYKTKFTVEFIAHGAEQAHERAMKLAESVFSEDEVIAIQATKPKEVPDA